MAVHGVAFMSLLDDAQLRAIPPVADETVFIAGNDLMVPAGHANIVGATAVGTDLTRAVFDSPKIRTISRVDIAPIDTGSLPTDHMHREIPLMNPIPVEPGEALNVLAQNSGGAVQRKVVGVWLSDGPIQPVTGADMRTVRGTTNFNTVINSWASGQVTLDVDLPAGTYTVLGFRAYSAGLQLARLIFPQQGLRPMVIGNQSLDDDSGDVFRFGKLGALGQFQNFVPPKLECLSNTADANPTVFLDVVRTGA